VDIVSTSISPTDADLSPAGRPAFDDLLAANQTFAAGFTLSGFDGLARAGVAMVTCMDSRIDPLGMIGLQPGDAKILRNPGGRVTASVLIALVVAANLLEVERILIVEHTRCAMASATEHELKVRLSDAAGVDASWLTVDVITDQAATIAADVAKVRAHPLIRSSVEIGGFLYDVDTGLLTTVV
jgi:carbonic anhydrase